MAWEARAREVWIVSPDLSLDVGAGAMREVVARNLSRNIPYRYLIPDIPPVRSRARRLLAESPAGGHLEIRCRPRAEWSFVVEIALYDPTSPRRVGLMLAPSVRSETDCLLSPRHTARFCQAFARQWAGARPV
jgi:hypothetical protein